MLIVLAVLVVGGGITMAVSTAAQDAVSNLLPGKKRKAQPGGDEENTSAELFRDANGNPGLRLTADAVKGLGIKPVTVKLAREPLPLPPQIGTINYDVDRLYTVKPRFTGELAEFRMVLDTDTPSYFTKLRPIRAFDKVKPGDTLCVVWSRDLGEKKAALVDAVCALRLSQATLKRQLDIFQEGAMSYASVQVTKRQVQADSGAVLTAERTLKMWKLPDEEIDKIKREANIIIDQNLVRSADKEMKWARDEVKVPLNRFDANAELTIVEKNCNNDEKVDPGNPTPLFKLADLRRLQIWVHPPEEYLPILRERLAKRDGQGLKWLIRLQSESANAPPLTLDIVQVAPSLEPNQHTPIVMGYLDNPGGNKYLVGQFVTATIFVPPDPDTVEIPTEALNEVENQALVFVETNAAKREYTLKRVAVVRRFKQVTYVRTKLTPEEEQTSRAEVQRGRRPIQPLLPGERVITRGVVELTAALENLQARERPDDTDQ